MNRLSDIYYTTESYLFPMVEEEIGGITGKMKDFVLLKIIFPTYRKIVIGVESVTVRVKLLIGEGINCILQQGMEMCRWQRF